MRWYFLSLILEVQLGVLGLNLNMSDRKECIGIPSEEWIVHHKYEMCVNINISTKKYFKNKVSKVDFITWQKVKNIESDKEYDNKINKMSFMS